MPPTVAYLSDLTDLTDLSPVKTDEDAEAICELFSQKQRNSGIELSIHIFDSLRRESVSSGYR